MEGLLPTEAVYKRRIERRDSNSSIRKLVGKKDRWGIVNYFLDDVIRISEKYRGESEHIDFMDIVGAGNEALIDNVMAQKNMRYSNVSLLALEAVERGIRGYLLNESIDKINTRYDNDVVENIEYDHSGILQRKMDIEYAEEKIKEILMVNLTYRQREVLKLRMGIDDKDQSTLKEIGDVFKIKSQRVGQVFNKAVNRLSARSSLRKKLEEYIDVYRDYIHDPTLLPHFEDFVELKTALNTIKKEISRYSNREFDEFRVRYGLSKREFAEYLSSIYPKLLARNAFKLIELSEEEKKGIEENKIINRESFKDVQSMKNTIQRLKKHKKKLENSQKIDIKDQLREIYMPLFSKDRKQCLDLLIKESNSKQNPDELRTMYLSLHDYFKEVIERRYNNVKTEVDDFQKVDIELLSRSNSTIVASEMGTGKSLEFLVYAMQKEFRKVLILSTKSGTYATWPKEIRKHLGGEQLMTFLRGDTFRNEELLREANKAKWFLSTHSSATANINEIRRMKFDLIGLDECHKINNSATSQSIAITSLDSSNKVGISGFLFKNRKSELFPLLNWLYPADFPDRDEFNRVYCMDGKGIFKLQYELRKRMIMRFKEEVLKLPPVEHCHEFVEMDTRQRKEYQGLEENFIGWIKKKKINLQDINMGRVVLTKLHHLRQKAIEPKMPLISELVKKSIQESRKAVVYTTYIPAASEFRERFRRYGVCYIDGKSNNTERVKNVREFEKKDNKRVFVVTSAGAESIDLTPGSDLYIANKPLTFADEKQVLDRLHRRRQRRKVRAFHIKTNNTIDDRIEKLVDRKREEYKRVVHEARGFERWYTENEQENIKELIEGMLLK